jgi:hypothetical protein
LRSALSFANQVFTLVSQRVENVLRVDVFFRKDSANGLVRRCIHVEDAKFANGGSIKRDANGSFREHLRVRFIEAGLSNAFIDFFD